MIGIPAGPPPRRSLIDHLIACLWWLLFLGVVGAGTAVGVVMALWFALSPFRGLVLIVACWLGANVVGWTLANRAYIALARRFQKGRTSIRTDAIGPVAATPPVPMHRRLLRSWRYGAPDDRAYSEHSERHRRRQQMRPLAA